MTEDETNELKPCPFCGGEAVLRKTVEPYAADGTHPAGEFDAWFNIDCDHCAIQIGDEYRSEAIAAWNRRSLSPTKD